LQPFSALRTLQFPVKLSVKSDYAARAVLGLARHFQNGRSLKAEELADAYSIPANYLVQILIELKSKQIVKSVRGKQGGYLLTRPPSQVTLGEVLRSIHGAVFDSPALADTHCPPELRHAWKRLQKTLDETADAITFQQLLDEGAGKERMYYI
jgi:Rrf2 family protein